MLIVSDFRDYYDNAAAYGVDKTVVYKRETQELHLSPADSQSKPRKDAHQLGDCWDYRYCYALEESVLGYCGQLYPLLHVSRVRNWREPWEPLFCTYHPEIFADWLGSLPENVQRSWKFDTFKDKAYRERFFHGEHSRLKALFVQHGVPLFLYKRRHYYWMEADDYLRGDLCLNPCLRELEFQRMKDAPTAFQDIFMYMSGVLGMPAKPIVEISDAMKQAKHGLDGKYSFKKPPGKKTEWR